MLNDDSSVKLARVVKVLDCLDIKIKFVINGVWKMDGINEKLNKEIEQEVKLENLKKQAKLIIEHRKPITRARIQELKDQRKIDKDFE